jgi:predicted RNase H-like HicB family nuclease
MTQYSVRLERGDDGWWLATVRGVAGCMTQGKSIDQATARAREALSLFIGSTKASRAELVHEIVLQPGLREKRARVLRLVSKAEQIETERERARDEAYADFAKAGFSTRDMGKLFGVSHQRISQKRSAARR